MKAIARAKRIAAYYLRGDDYIAQHERSFDTQLESGNADEVVKEFRKLYDADSYLQRKCYLSRYFCEAIIGK